MSDSPIYGLPYAAPLSGAEIFPFDQGGSTVQGTANEILDFIIANGGFIPSSGTTPGNDLTGPIVFDSTIGSTFMTNNAPNGGTNIVSTGTHIGFGARDLSVPATAFMEIDTATGFNLQHTYMGRKIQIIEDYVNHTIVVQSTGGGTNPQFFKGFTYGADYSANYIGLSIPHLAFNDARYAPISASGYLALSGGTMNGNVLFNSNYGIDTTATGGTDVLNIGPTNAEVINIGNASTLVNILGWRINEYATNAYVTDKLMTLNSGGTLASGIGVGFEIEENGTITGFFKTDGMRQGIDIKMPAIPYTANLTLGYLSTNRVFAFPDTSGSLATIDGGQTFTNAIWQGNSISTTYTAAKIKGSASVNSGVLYQNGTADTATTDAGMTYNGSLFLSAGVRIGSGTPTVNTNLLLDIFKNNSGGTYQRIINQSTNAAAYSGFNLQDSATSAWIYKLGTAYGPSGLFTASSLLFDNTGDIGINVSTGNSIKFGINNVVKGTFLTGGNFNVVSGGIDSTNRIQFLNGGSGQYGSVRGLEIGNTYGLTLTPGQLVVGAYANFNNGGSVVTRANSNSVAVFGNNAGDTHVVEFWYTGGAAFLMGSASQNFSIQSNAMGSASITVIRTTGNVNHNYKSYFGGSGTPTSSGDFTSISNAAHLRLIANVNVSLTNDGEIGYNSSNLLIRINTVNYTLPKTLTGSASLDFPSTAAGTSSDLTITVTGAALNDKVLLGVPHGSTFSDSCYTAWVSAVDTVTIRFNNYGTSVHDPASGTFKVSVIKD